MLEKVEKVNKVLAASIVLLSSVVFAEDNDYIFRENTGTSFEKYSLGEVNFATAKEGEESDPKYYWRETDASAVYYGFVTNYIAGEAYDYRRSPAYLGPNTNKLELSLSGSLVRYIHEESGGWRTIPFSEIYCDTLVKFEPDNGLLDLESEDKVAIRAHIKADDASVVTQLVITAGIFVDDFSRVAANNYVVDKAVDFSVWHRLTIRTITNLVSQATKFAQRPVAPAFEVYLDEELVSATLDSYENDLGLKSVYYQQLSPTAQQSIKARTIFPSLSAISSDASKTLRGLAFKGDGEIDNIAYTNVAPSFVVRPRVFKLQWGNGITELKYSLDGGAELSVSDLSIGETNIVVTSATQLKLNPQYAPSYTNGVWTTKGCELTDKVITFGPALDAYAKLNTKAVSSEGVFAVDSAETLSDAVLAINNLTTGEVKIVLNDDITTDIKLVNSSVKVTIDLNGHSLCGAQKDVRFAIINSGNLRIIDSANVGKFESAVGQLGVIQNKGALTIGGGIFEADVVNITNNPANAKLVITGGTFKSTNTTEFVLNDYVTNSLYYAYEDGYWKPIVTNAYIWCGGNGTAWSTKENWQNGKVPGLSDNVVFPKGKWAVSFGDVGLDAPTNIWLYGEIETSGLINVSDVKWQYEGGRFIGNATLWWKKKLAPSLTELLGEAWQGTVKISWVTRPSELTNLNTWGKPGSTVCFNGVDGHLSAIVNYDLPFALELLNDGTNPAWKNQAGFTGNVLSFAQLKGSGDLVFTRNTIKIMQVVQFRDLAEYTGKMTVLGKRVLLGEGEMSVSLPGAIVFSDGVVIKSPLNSKVSVASAAGFNKSIVVVGEPGNTALLTGLTTIPEFGPTLAYITNSAGTITATNELYVTAESPYEVKFGPVKSTLLKGLPLKTSALSSLTKDGGYYESVTKDGMSVLQLKEFAIPVIGCDESGASMSIKDGYVYLTITNVKKGLWYGLEFCEQLGEPWVLPEKYYRLDDDSAVMELSAPAPVASGFYRVVVLSDEEMKEVK